jgi:hypothetical protein
MNLPCSAPGRGKKREQMPKGYAVLTLQAAAERAVHAVVGGIRYSARKPPLDIPPASHSRLQGFCLDRNNHR